MLARPLPDVGCLDGSIEGLFRGFVWGSVAALVFRPKHALRLPFVGGGWAFLASFSFCSLKRDGGIPAPFAGAIAGTYAGGLLAMLNLCG